MEAKESPFKEWSAALRKCAGILDYSRAAVFALIRGATENVHHFPVSLQTYINANLTETDHEHPTEEMLAAARHTPEESWEKEINDKVAAGHAKDVKQPEVANMGNGVFSIDGLMGNQTEQPLSIVDQARQHAAEEKLNPANSQETTSNVPMEETVSVENKAPAAVPESQTADLPVESDATAVEQTTALNTDSGHHNDDAVECPDFHHLMLDVETMGSNPDAPIVSIGAVFFNPDTGVCGPEFYKVISLESAMASGGIPDASTIIWWLKQSSEARAAIVVDDAIPLDDALLQFNEFISENAAGSAGSVQVWGNGATFDNVLMRRSYERNGIVCSWKFFNDRDVRTIVELGKAVGINPRYSIPFEGDKHNALADARHQAKYVSAIWQRLTAN